MEISLREGRIQDARECGRILHSAFAAIAGAHNFPPDFPDAATAAGIVRVTLGHPGFFSVVAERAGRIVGSNFLDERNTISAVGPVTVDPDAQNSSIGARLMQAAIERSASKGFAGIRLLQAGYHCRSLALYFKLGFNAREHICCLQGTALNEQVAGYAVRPATDTDFAACNALCEQVHGAARAGELRDALSHRVASVVERGGRITGYTTAIAFIGHAVCETTDDLKALISAAKSFDGPGFLAPSRNGELMRWCLSKGLRITQTMTLMTMGLYNEPTGAYLASVGY